MHAYIHYTYVYACAAADLCVQGGINSACVRVSTRVRHTHAHARMHAPMIVRALI